MNQEPPTLPQSEYGRIAYALAQDRIAHEHQLQMHLWTRFRDAIQLSILIMTAAGAALKSLTGDTVIGVIGQWLAAGSVASLVYAAWPLHRVFSGADYHHLHPKSVQKAFRERSRTFHDSNEIDLADDGDKRLFPVRSEEEIKWGGEIPAAIIGQVYEDLAETLLQAACANYSNNHRRGVELDVARERISVALWLALVGWGCFFFQS